VNEEAMTRIGSQCHKKNDVSLNKEAVQNWVCLPQKRELAVCVSSFVPQQSSGPRENKEAERTRCEGRIARGLGLCSAGLSVSVKVLALSNDS